jgi:succinate dehydrogenase/fumarate reductase flavoprotein subunit
MQEVSALPINDTDVLIIGGGMAGLCAAISSASNGSKTMIVTKTLVGAANTTSIAGGILSAVTSFQKNCDTAEKHFQDALRAGQGINDKSLLKAMVDGLPKCVDRLIEMGVEMDGGEFPKPRFIPGHSNPRSYMIKGGGVSLQAILKKQAGVLGVQWIERTTITDLVSWEGRIIGAIGYKNDTNEVKAIRSNAVVLATGGPGELYSRNLYPMGSSGYGCSLGLRVGAKLVSMEYIQFYPMMVFETGLPKLFIDYSPLLEKGAVVTNSIGEDILRKRGISEPYKMPRDSFSIIIFEEMKGLNGENPVYLDCTRVWDEVKTDDLSLKVVKDLDTKRVPTKKRRFGISPYAHTCMGGLKSDVKGSTNVPGLYVAGEAMGALHGANRIGGNALAACLFFGYEAGRSSSLYAQALSTAPSAPFIEPASEITEKVNQCDINAPNPQSVVKEVQKLMWEKVGIIRDGKGLTNAMAKLNSLKNTTFKSGVAATSLLFPMMLETAEVTCLSALHRKESRGAHYRLDVPKMENAWEKRIMIQLREGKYVVRYENA